VKRVITGCAVLWCGLLVLSISPVARQVNASVNTTAVLIALGGCAAAAALALALARGLRLDRLVRPAPAPASPEQLAAELTACAELVQRQGLLALASWRIRTVHPLMERGVAAVVEGVDPAALREDLERRHAALAPRTPTALASHLRTFARATPVFAVAVAGAVLVWVLRRETAPGAVPTTTPALLGATLAMLAGLTLVAIAAPLADRLERAAARDELAAAVVIEGLVGLASGEGPEALARRLATLTAPPEQDAQTDAAARLRGLAA
jgi:flagellar motor component MotA